MCTIYSSNSQIINQKVDDFIAGKDEINAEELVELETKIAEAVKSKRLERIKAELEALAKTESIEQGVSNISLNVSRTRFIYELLRYLDYF